MALNTNKKNYDIVIMSVCRFCLYWRCLVAPRVRTTLPMTLRNSCRLKQDVNRYIHCPFSLAYEDMFCEEVSALHRPGSKKVIGPHWLSIENHDQIAFIFVPLCLFLSYIVSKKLRVFWRHGKFGSSTELYFFLLFIFPYLTLLGVYLKEFLCLW